MLPSDSNEHLTFDEGGLDQNLFIITDLFIVNNLK